MWRWQGGARGGAEAEQNLLGVLLAGVLVGQDVVGHYAHMGGNQVLLSQHMPARPCGGVRGRLYYSQLELCWFPAYDLLCWAAAGVTVALRTWAETPAGKWTTVTNVHWFGRRP